MSLGNHEFDKGVDGLAPFIETVSSPVLAANLDLTKVPKLSRCENLKKTVIFNVSDTEVGVIGYITPETKRLAVPNDVEYIDEIKALQDEVNRLQQLGINIIIALGHSGYKRDQEIAKEVEGLDLVIGAHSHTFLWNGTAPDSEDSQGNYPTYVTQKSGKVVPVVQAYAFTKYLGYLNLLFDSNGELIQLNGKPIILDSSIAQDPDILNILEKYRKNITDYYQVVGRTSVILDAKTCEKMECNMGNLITDAIIHRYASLYNGNYWTDAPIAAIQAGGIRASIAHSKLQTAITKEELVNVLPFKEKILAVNMNGSILLQMLEHAVSRYEVPNVGEFLQFSGMKVKYNVTNPVGSRVVSAEARCSECTIPKYSKVEVIKPYKVLLNKFLYRGGDGFQMLKNLEMKLLNFTELTAMQYYLEHLTPIYPAIEGRITIIENLANADSSSLKPVLYLTVFTISLILFL